MCIRDSLFLRFNGKGSVVLLRLALLLDTKQIGHLFQMLTDAFPVHIDFQEEMCIRDRLYLSPILDLCSSDLVSYTISDHPVLSMVTTMLDKAFEKIPDGTCLLYTSRCV